MPPISYNQDKKASKKSTVKAATRALTTKQKKFADEFIDTGNKTQSALKAYDTDDYGAAAVIGHENLKKVNVREYIEGKAQRAAEITYNIAENGENDGVRLSAARDIQDRAGLKAPEKHINISMPISLEERNKILGISTKVREEMTQNEING